MGAETLSTDVGVTLVAMAGIALAIACLSAAAFALVGITDEKIPAWWRTCLVGVWGAGVFGATLAAAPVSLWGVPLAAAVALPVLSLVARRTLRPLLSRERGMTGLATRSPASDERI